MSDQTDQNPPFPPPPQPPPFPATPPTPPPRPAMTLGPAFPHPTARLPGGSQSMSGGGHFGPPPRPQVVHIVSKPGGFAWAWGTMLGLVMLLVVLCIGLFMGIIFAFGAAAGASGDEFVVRSTYREGGSRSIAVIPVLGEIDGRQAEFVHAAVNHVLEDSDVRAVVLRVDSPGGEVAPSDQIWYEVERLKKEALPVVASYGGMAASGGYYVSCGADHIIAEETCITGSIGVIAQVLTFDGLMDKVGVTPVTIVATGSPEKAIANDTFRAWTERDKQTVRTMLDSAYAIFARRVRDGRKNAISDPAAIDSVANGAIYTAQQAKDNGLIDGLGYLDDAIAKAETMAGLAPGSGAVVMVRKPPSLFGDGFLMQAARNAGARSPRASDPGAFDADAVRSLVNNLTSPRILYRMH